MVSRKSYSRSLLTHSYSSSINFLERINKKLKGSRSRSEYEGRVSPVKYKSSRMLHRITSLSNFRTILSTNKLNRDFCPIYKPHSSKSAEHDKHHNLSQPKKIEENKNTSKKEISDVEEDGEIKDDDDDEENEFEEEQSHISVVLKEDTKMELENKQEPEEGELVNDLIEKDGVSKNEKRKIKEPMETLSSDEESCKNEKDEEDSCSSKNVESDKNLVEFICPHCKFESNDFIEYTHHLSQKQHLKSMRILSNKKVLQLKRLRSEQREKQRCIEFKLKKLSPITYYCGICKFHYRTSKFQHINSLDHRRMKEFVQPYCLPCKISFKSPWAFQSHLCNPYHLKSKKKSRSKECNDIIDMLDADYMVLDEVGSEDDELESSESKSTEDENTECQINMNAENSSKNNIMEFEKEEEIKLGAEHCLLVDVYYCSLCKAYLPRDKGNEKALLLHCRSRIHIQKYKKYCDQTFQNENDSFKHMVKNESSSGNEKTEDMEMCKDEIGSNLVKNCKGDKDDWSDLDKDLTDLLQESEDKIKEFTDDSGIGQLEAETKTDI